MEKVRKTYYKEKQILIIDYSDCHGENMIEVFKNAKQLALAENRSVLILSIFNNKTYVTPAFMRYVEGHVKEVQHLIDKQAIIGLTTAQKWILKGYNLWSKPQLLHFDTYEEALKFLVATNE